MKEEFYLRPILCVTDVPASIAYYTEKLGFEAGWSFPGDAPIIAQVGRNGLDLILDAESSIPRAATPTVLSLSLHDAQGLGALHDELQGRGAELLGPPSEVSWQEGVLQLVARDPDGNVLVFWGDSAGSGVVA